MERGETQYVAKRIEQNFVDTQVAFVYEDVCREELWQLSSRGFWPFTFERVGRWWDNSNEIDGVVLDSSGNNLLLCECKCWQEPVGSNVLYALEAKAPLVKWHNDCCQTWLALFSASGFTEELRELASKRQDVQLLEYPC